MTIEFKVSEEWQGYLIIPPDGEGRIEPVSWETWPSGSDRQVSAIQNIVGGYIEYVPIFLKGAHMYCDEEGKLKGKAINNRATMLLQPGHRRVDFIVGTVVVMKETLQGDEAPLVPADLDVLNTILGPTVNG